MKLFALILFLPFTLFAQFRGIHVKFESHQARKSAFTTIYISGQKNVRMEQLGIPSARFYPIWLNECKPVQILIDDYQSKSFQTLGFLCGDSVIINIDNGYSKVINRVYPEYEQNYSFYRNEFFTKNKFSISTRTWKDLHQLFKLEKKFIEESFAHHKFSDSFYRSLILDLPYKVNNYILRAPIRYTEVVKDSLIDCKWNKDSLINTENYLEYVTGYIHYFELPQLKNEPEQQSAFFKYAYNNTSGLLREQLCYWQLLTPFADINSNYLNQFAAFKKITANKELIKNIEEKMVIPCLISTQLGDITIELYPAKAPVTVANFLKYVDAHLYDSSSFFRAVTLDNQPNNAVKIEVIQGGNVDSLKDFAPIKMETTEQTGLLHKDGTISMARGAPASATSSFFICINDQPSLDYGGKRNPDGQGFAAFGKVVKGMDTVKRIQQLYPEQGQYFKPPVTIISITRIQ